MLWKTATWTQWTLPLTLMLRGESKKHIHQIFFSPSPFSPSRSCLIYSSPLSHSWGRGLPKKDDKLSSDIREQRPKPSYNDRMSSSLLFSPLLYLLFCSSPPPSPAFLQAMCENVYFCLTFFPFLFVCLLVFGFFL